MAQLISTDKHFDSILIGFIENRKNANAKLLLQCASGQQLDLVDYTGSTLLHYAVKFNNIEIVCHLINMGCKPDVSNNKGNTPLMLAVVNCRVNLVKVLLRDINFDNLRKLFNIILLNSEKVCSEIVEMVLQQFKRANFDDQAIVQLFLKKRCPLYYAVLLNSIEIIKIMIDDGCSVNVKNPHDGNSPLHVAAAFGNLKLVQLLIKHGADVNAVNNKGEIPLNHEKNCFSGENFKILKILVEEGSSLSSCDKSGHMQTVNVFRHGNGPAIKMILRSYLDLNVQDSNGDTVIHYCAVNDRPDTFLHLMKQNFNPNIQNKIGVTPLHIVASRNDSRAMWLLLAKGADVNIKTHKGASLLGLVISRYKYFGLDCVRELLVEYEADIQFVTYDGNTVFDYMLEIDIVFSHLALLEAQGKKIIEPLRQKIDSMPGPSHFIRPSYKSRFEQFKSKLERLKTVKVYESITIFHLLTDSKPRIRSYLRNKPLATKLRDLLDCKHDIHWFHFEILKKRVTEALNIMKWQEKAAFAFCKGLGNEVKFADFIINEVMCYLSLEDMKSLAAIDFFTQNTSALKRPVSAVRTRQCKRQKIFK